MKKSLISKELKDKLIVIVKDKYSTRNTIDISGKEDIIHNIIKQGVMELEGDTYYEKRIRLPRIKNDLHLAVDLLNGSGGFPKMLPDNIDKVDGSIVRPILNRVIEDRLALLPKTETSDGGDNE